MIVGLFARSSRGRAGHAKLGCDFLKVSASAWMAFCRPDWVARRGGYGVAQRRPGPMDLAARRGGYGFAQRVPGPMDLVARRGVFVSLCPQRGGLVGGMPALGVGAR